jgi:hypothetical protein
LNDSKSQVQNNRDDQKRANQSYESPHHKINKPGKQKGPEFLGQVGNHFFLPLVCDAAGEGGANRSTTLLVNSDVPLDENAFAGKIDAPSKFDTAGV